MFRSFGLLFNLERAFSNSQISRAHQMLWKSVSLSEEWHPMDQTSEIQTEPSGDTIDQQQQVPLEQGNVCYQ